MLRIILATYFLFFGGVAYAAVDLDKFRAILNSGDVAALETAVRDLHSETLMSGNHDDVRRLNARLFKTTHPDRMAVINSWVETYPNSPYALAAKAWMHILHAGLHRGTDWAARTSRGSLDNYRLQQDLAKGLARKAFLKAPDYLPASDAILVTYSIHDTDAFDLDLHISQVMEAAPNHRTIELATGSVSPQWGGSTEQMFRICAKFAAQVSGYDADLCITDVIITGGMHIDLRNIAYEIIQARGDEISDQTRLTAYTDGYYPHAEAHIDETIIMHLAFFGKLQSDFEVPSADGCDCQPVRRRSLLARSTGESSGLCYQSFEWRPQQYNIFESGN